MKFLIIFAAVTLFAVAESKYVVPLNLNPDYNLAQDGNGNWFIVNENDAELGLETFFVASTDVFFRLFTRSNTATYQTISLTDGGASLDASFFNAANPTFFIAHGWNNDGTSEMPVTTKYAYLAEIDCNVFIVDWGIGANDINYYAVIGRVPDVGSLVGDMILFLEAQTGHLPSNVQIVGHSLGAHIAGFAGKRVNALGTTPVGKIVGLDTTSLGYDASNTLTRLYTGDATYVQTLHTSALGFQVAIGHASFFANFGTSQPGCGWDWFSTCAHGRSHLYHTESIGSTNGFTARRCVDISQISGSTCTATGSAANFGGVALDTAASGVFWLPVNTAAPFALGLSGIV